MAPPLEIRYLGWSGVVLVGAGGVVAIDPFGEGARWDALPEGTTAICLTHGHPEHCGSARALLVKAEAQRLASTHLVSSPQVTRHVAPGRLLAPERVHAVAARQRLRIDSLRVSTFAWSHLPLLPPESLRAKAGYAASLLRHPVAAARIGLAGARLPLRAPYLGFHVTFADGRTVLNYAEGLHRMTDPGEVSAVADRLAAATLLFAVEPEDVEAIPRWLDVLRPREAVLYEAHRPWRELFGLPHLDLEHYAAQLRARFPTIAVRALCEVGDLALPA
ncbi:MAG TPA: MBL fold metallo-hydrolase [Solirubrobacterales bacterium]|nr:MBL fold metallo-hydrolase [Solirubrobacterales bacterium]